MIKKFDEFIKIDEYFVSQPTMRELEAKKNLEKRRQAKEWETKILGILKDKTRELILNNIRDYRHSDQIVNDVKELALKLFNEHGLEILSTFDLWWKNYTNDECRNFNKHIFAPKEKEKLIEYIERYKELPEYFYIYKKYNNKY